MCHAHHLTHWADGGNTNLDNLALFAATTTASSTTRPGRSASTHTTDNPNSSHHPNPESSPNGSDIARAGKAPRRHQRCDRCPGYLWDEARSSLTTPTIADPIAADTASGGGVAARGR